MGSPVNSARDNTTDARDADPPAPRVEHTQVPPLAASREQPLSDLEEAQVQKIINATDARDWHALATLAASPGGFIDDEVRRIVCTCKVSSILPPIVVLNAA